jgi:DNA-directed RNA polymerase subunit F
MIYAHRMENCDADEAEEFLEELAAPLSAKERRAEKNIGRWLRG